MNREQLVKAIHQIEATIELPRYISEIFKSVKAGECHSRVVDKFLLDYNVHEAMAKIDFIATTLEYIKTILEDNALTDETRENVQFLKILFRIHPGDFYLHKKMEIEQIIKYQLAKFYDDRLVSSNELQQTNSEKELEESEGINKRPALLIHSLGAA